MRISVWPLPVPEATSQCMHLTEVVWVPCDKHVPLCVQLELSHGSTNRPRMRLCRCCHPGKSEGSAERASSVWFAIANVGSSLHGCWPALRSCIRLFVCLICCACSMHCPDERFDMCRPCMTQYGPLRACCHFYLRPLPNPGCTSGVSSPP